MSGQKPKCKTPHKRRCIEEGCFNYIVRGKKCIKHGAIIKKCRIKNCDKLPQHSKNKATKGMCRFHQNEFSATKGEKLSETNTTDAVASITNTGTHEVTTKKQKLQHWKDVMSP